MTVVSMGNGILFAANHGVMVREEALEVTPQELFESITLAFSHMDDRLLRDAGCGGCGLLYDRANGRFSVSYEEYLEILEEAEAITATKNGKKTLTKMRRSEFNTVKADLQLTLIDQGYEYRCVGCDTLENLSLDHITPLSRGGSDDLSNLQFLCQSCNSRKGVTV